MEALVLSVLPVYSPSPRFFTPTTTFKIRRTAVKCSPASSPLLNHSSKFKEAAMHGNLIPIYRPITSESDHLTPVLAYRCLAKEDDDRDAEALNKFASFTWMVRNDIYMAEEAYQEAIEAEPGNSDYQADYAFFLLHTGGDGTCYRLREDDRDATSSLFESVVPGPKVEPNDAEALNKFANFMWMVRNDEQTAEEAYQEAIEADPENSHYQADYAYFLLRIGGDVTRYRLSSLDSSV